MKTYTTSAYHGPSSLLGDLLERVARAGVLEHAGGRLLAEHLHLARAPRGCVRAVAQRQVEVWRDCVRRGRVCAEAYECRE